MKRLIDANALWEGEFIEEENEYQTGWNDALRGAQQAAPTVDAVEVEKYNDLREAFVDFVCSGVHNPAPYCKNKCPECTDERGWCTYSSCTGFNPDGERREE